MANKPSIFDQPTTGKPSIFDAPTVQAKPSVFDSDLADFAAYKQTQTAVPDEGNTEFAPVVPGETSSPSVAPSLPSGKDLLSWFKAVPGRVKKFAQEKEAEHQIATAVQQQKLGMTGQKVYSMPNPLLTGLSPEAVVEAGKTVAGKIENLWEHLRPSDAKRNALWAERDLKDLVKEVGDGQPTPQQLQRYKDRRAFANQMWAMTETDRAKRNETVRGFQERMDKATLPGTPGAKFIGKAVPLAIQGAVAPETIPADLALSHLAEGESRNPAWEQTLTQQAKEFGLGYGAGIAMMSGVPGVPVSRALQGVGVPVIPANVAGAGVTSVANTLGGHQLSRWLTTAHGEAPPQPTASDYLGDFATQLGLSAQHLNAPAHLAPAGAPPLGEPAVPVGMGAEPLKTPSAPGGLNLPAPTTAEAPAPVPVQGPAALPATTPGKLQTIFPGIPPEPTVADIVPGTSFGWKGKYAGESSAKPAPESKSDMTPGASGRELLSNEEIQRSRRGDNYYRVDRSGRVTNLGPQPDAPVRNGEAIFMVSGRTGKLQVQNSEGLGNDKAVLSRFGPRVMEIHGEVGKVSRVLPPPIKPPPPPPEIVSRPQPSASEGLPDAYGLAPVEVAPHVPTPRANLHEHEAEMATTRQQRMGDRATLVNGPLAAVADIAPEHHAEADRIAEARNIVTITERRALEAERKITALKLAGKEIPAELEQQAKSRNAPGMEDLRQIAASEPSHPDAQRALQVAQEQQQALAAEYAASTPGGEGDITHASRNARKEAQVEPSFEAKASEFFGGPSTTPAETGVPGTGKRPKQKNEYSKERKYETVDGPAGPVVVYRDLNPDGSHDIVGRSGKILESDITGRRESTKEEITHATSQVEVPGEIDPETGEQGPSHIELDPAQAIHFSQNAVAAAVKARESARDAIRGRRVIDNLKANPQMFREGEAPKGSEWRNVSDLPITQDIKNRLAPGGKAASVRSDVAHTLITYFGEPLAKEAHFLSGLDRASHRWTERGLLTNFFAHFQNQFAHGLGALSGEGLNHQPATKALFHAYREGQNPNSEYVNRARAAGVKQMSQGRIFGEGDNATAYELATQKLEAALGHAPGTLGKMEGNSLKRAFQALNQKTVWQVDDAIRNTLFYQKVASGMTPEQAARYANENYVGYHTDTNLFELNPDRSPRSLGELAKKTANMLYRETVTGKGEASRGGAFVRAFISPLFHTFRTNSATLLAHELKNAATELPQGSLKGLGKLVNVAATGSAVGGMVGQSLSDALLSEEEKKQGKEYQMRMGGPFHWYDTAEKALEGRATPMQTAAAIATPNPLFKHLIGKGIFGVDVQSGRQAPARSLAELGDTLLSSVLPTGDIARNALQGQGNAKDVAASFLMGKNAPKPGAQIMLAHPDKAAAAAPDYEQTKANYRLISTLRDLTPGSKEYTDAIQQAVKDQLLTKQQIINATKRAGQSELEHMRALAKIATPDAIVSAAETYRESSPEIARALYAEAQKKLGTQAKKFTGERNLKLLGQIQRIENQKLLLR